MIHIAPISNEDARIYFEKHSAFRGSFTDAIAAHDETGTCHGVVAFTCDGARCTKDQISTDGSGQVGTLLYGALMRTAMAKGYSAVHFGK